MSTREDFICAVLWGNAATREKAEAVARNSRVTVQTQGALDTDSHGFTQIEAIHEPYWALEGKNLCNLC